MLALLAGVLVVTAAALSWLLGTASGNAWLLARAPLVSVTQAAGRVFGGPFSAQRVEVRAASRVIVLERLAWQDARWAWRPHDGAWFGLVIDGMTIERAQIDAATTTASTTPAAAPATLRLPFALTVGALRIGELRVDATAPLRDIATRIELGHDAGREHRVPSLTLRADRATANASARIATDAPFALEAQLQAASIDGATRPWQASAKASGPLAAIAVTAQLTSPQAAGARLDAEATVSPFAAWPLSQLLARTRALDLSALLAEAPQTSISGEARIDTQGLDKPITASVTLKNAAPGRWDERRLPLTDVELDIAGRADQRDRLTLRRFELRAPGNGGVVTGQGEWGGSTATVDLTLQALRPALLDNRAPAMTLSGTFGSRWLGLPSPDGTAPASGTLQLQSKLALEGRLDGKRGERVHIGAGLQGERSADTLRLSLNDAQARAGAASLRGALQAERSSSGAMQLKTQGQAQGFDPSSWSAAAPAARLNGAWNTELHAPASWRFDARSAASWLALRGKTELDLKDSTLAGVPLQATLRADGAAAGWSVDAKASAANNKVVLQGLLAARADADRWRADIDAPALAALRPLVASLAPRAGLDGLEGRANAQLQSSGRWPALRTSGTLRGSALRAGAFSAAQLDAQWQAAPEPSAPLSLKVESQRLARGEVSFDTLRASVGGTLATHRIDIDGTSTLRPPAWTDTLLGANAASGSALKLRGEGRWLAEPRGGGQWRAKLDELDARGGAAKQAWLAARNIELRLAFDAQGGISEAQALPGAATVLGAALTWREARWQAATPQRAAQVALDAQLEPLAIAPWLQRLQPEARIGGDLSVKGRAVVSNNGNSFAADVVLERAGGDLTVTSDGVTQTLGMTDLRLSLVADQGTWHFAQAVAGSNLGVLVGATSLRLPPAATWPAAETPMQGVLEWRVADLGVWAPFTPPGWRVGGRLRTSAAIGGRFGAPEIEGRMEGSGLAVRNLLLGVDLRDGELALSLRGADARVERFVFKGGDGELRLTGGAVLGAEPKATLQVVADKFRLLGRVDRRVVTSGNATLSLDAKSLAVGGELHIDEGLIDISRADAPSLDSDVTVRGGRQAADKAAEKEEAEVIAARDARTVRDLRINVQLDLGDKLRLRGRGLDTRLAGRLTITSPNNRLALSGPVRAVDGQYAAYGQKLTIERGEIGFSGELDNPRLDILAVRPNLDVSVGVQVTGTAQSPRVRLASTPEMADYDKLSWLMLGRAPDGLARNDTALLQRAALAILAGEGQGIDTQLLSRLGLDEFSLRQVDNGEVRETVVALGKQLSRRWYLGYERSVNNTTGTWQLIYRAAQRFTLRAQSGEDNSLDAIWTWRWN